MVKFDLKGVTNNLISTGMPFIFKGMINEFLAEKEIDISKAVDWVTGKKDLLMLFKEYGGTDFDAALQRAGSFVTDTNWLTTDWLIDACRDEHPDVASLFLGWEEGRTWLDIQIEEIREQFVRANGQVIVVDEPATAETKKTVRSPAPTPPRSPDALPASNEQTEKSDERKPFSLPL